MSEVMNIHRCEAWAKDAGHDSAQFIAAFPSGLQQCTWLDAYMGIFTIEGMEGFAMVRDIDREFPSLACFPIGGV